MMYSEVDFSNRNFPGIAWGSREDRAGYSSNRLEDRKRDYTPAHAVKLYPLNPEPQHMMMA